MSAADRNARRRAELGRPLYVVSDDAPQEPPRCPYCDRVMTWRERDEQHCCNDCYEGQP